MKIFVLEDNSERVMYFTLMFLNHALLVTNNAGLGRMALHNEKFDMMFLDHDLGGQVFVDSSEPNTGHYLCKHMHETMNIDTPVVIHSWNGPGAENMESVLKCSGHRGSVSMAMFGQGGFEAIVKLLLSNAESALLKDLR
jgi:hypothetical protein